MNMVESSRIFDDLAKKLGNTLHLHIEKKKIDLTAIDDIQALVLLCEIVPKLPTGADRTCLEHEVHASATAFCEGRYDDCKKHLYQAHQWQFAIQRDQAEYMAKFQKTPAD